MRSGLIFTLFDGIKPKIMPGTRGPLRPGVDGRQGSVPFLGRNSSKFPCFFNPGSGFQD